MLILFDNLTDINDSDHRQIGHTALFIQSHYINTQTHTLLVLLNVSLILWNYGMLLNIICKNRYILRCTYVYSDLKSEQS